MDICDHIEGVNAKTKIRAQERAVMDYSLAALIGCAIGGSNKMPRSPQKAYPWLFEGGKKTADWTVIKANMQAYQRVHNARRRKAGDKD